MSKKIIATEHAPGAIGPYAQGIAIGNLVFTSGQLPIDMRTGELESADIALATRYALENVCAILVAAGLELSQVVKVTVFLTDLADFAAVNQAYAEFFAQDPPARSCVQVAALPKGARIEIEAVAAR
ncbi:MAG: RidA family protein [Clostridia bacterium]|nr:RidA family protein [Clostridia bacterium]